FGRAYHTPLFKPLADAFREYFKDLDFGPGQVPLYSARSCAPFPNTPDEIRELAAQQWENPVRFTQTLERLYADGYRIFLEVGPSANLSAFVTDSLRKREGVLALSCNTRRKPALSHFLNTLGQLFAAGVTLDLPVLYAQRQIEALDLSVAPKAGKLKAAKKALAMPAVQLPEKWRKPLPQAPTHPASQRPPSAAPETAPLANPQNPPANPGDPQAAALQAHFTLMQEFLDSQARVLGLATGQSAAAPEAEAASAPPSDDLRYPLLGAIIESKPGRLVMQRDYSLHTDAFLGDHCIGGTPSQNDPQLGALAVIPFTFSMEICAEAAARLIDRQDRVFVGMQNARGSRWLSFDHDQLQLRIIADHAQRQPDHDVIDCKLYLQGQGGPEGGLLVFEASVELAKDYPAAPPPTPWRAEQDHPQQFHPPGQLYEAGMFHGPRLQGCTRLPRWSDDGIEVQMRCLPTQDYFSFTPTPNFQFDAALLDAAGQAAGFWLQESGHEAVNCFPFRVRRLRVFAAPPAAGSSALCRGQIQMEDDTRLHARWDIIGPGDQLIMQAQGWEDRLFAVDRRLHHFRMDPPRRFLSQDWLSGQLPAGFSACRLPAFENNLLREGGGIWGRTLAYMVLNAQERAQFNALPTDTPRRDEWLMGRIAAKEAVRHWLQQRQQIQLASADIQIDNDAQGRPLARIIAAPHIAAPSISISHSRGQAAAIAADPGLLLGLDYQHLDRVQTSDLINGGFDQSEHRWFKPHSPAAQKLVAVALWSAKEAAAKCAGTGLKGQPASWRVVECHLDPPSVAYGSARVEHDGASFDVVLQFESESAVSALCVAAPSGQAPPPPVHLNPSPSHELH
ncbi:MAG: 4'-phosphopantetheinyl transferase superfamily protein, partial [Panacagrimonas sp.]